MTTFEPGANVVFTHGLEVRPSSTAFLASSAAAIITDGLEVFVQLVIAAMTTAPWSSSTWAPLSSVTGVGLLGRSTPSPAGTGTLGRSAGRAVGVAGESLAGTDSAEDWSTLGPSGLGSSGT